MVKNDKQDIKTWMPSLKWMLKVLAIIYIVIIAAFFTLNYLLKPYMRDIPKELTPWMEKNER